MSPLPAMIGATPQSLHNPFLRYGAGATICLGKGGSLVPFTGDIVVGSLRVQDIHSVAVEVVAASPDRSDADASTPKAATTV
jgi:hypothetical protein